MIRKMEIKPKGGLIAIRILRRVHGTWRERDKIAQKE